MIPEAPAATPELQRLRNKAKHEIGERDDLILLRIADVREVLEADNTVNVPPKSFDEFLLRCLRARKYDVHRAAKTYKKLCQVHHKQQDVTDYALPSKYNTLLKSKFTSLLKSRDSLGRHILFIQVKHFDGSRLSINEALATLIMYIDQAAESIDTQYNGLVVLIDLKGFGFSIARQLTPGKIQAVVNIIQDSYPARFKEFHFVNHPSLFNMAFAVAKTFLKEKIRNRIFFHGHDTASVCKSINPSLLPVYLGGSVPDNEYFDEEALSSLLNKDEYFKGMKEHFVVLDEVYSE